MFASLVVVFLVIGGCDGAARTTLGFGSSINPTVWLNLDEANHTGTQCVIINGKELCTTVEYCPAYAYQCSYLDPNKGHGCALSTSECSCVATYDAVPCSCDLQPTLPFWVTPSVRCFDANNNQVLTLSLSDVECSDPMGFYYPDRYKNETTQQQKSNACHRGSGRFSNPKLIEVFWNCDRKNDGINVQTKNMDMSRSSLEPQENCNCHARHGHKDCYSCQPCASYDPGDFRVVCPGFFMDCFQTYSFWEETEGETTSGTFGTATAPIILLAVGTTALSLLLLPK